MYTDIIFYKRILVTGGAEVLFNEHYKYLKRHGAKPLVVTFEINDLDRVNIPKNDVCILSSNHLFRQLKQLRKVIKDNKFARLICHSGYIEFGMASLSLNRPYSIFVHQPTSMSFNESDKFSIFYWSKFKKLFSYTPMFNELVKRHSAIPLLHKIILNVRAILSQYILKRAKRIFVLSRYARHEKKQLFGIDATTYIGALDKEYLGTVFKCKRPHKKKQIPKIVTLSRLDENKRIDIIIRAVKKLWDDGNGVTLDICGTGPAKENLEKLSKDLELEAYVKFLGYVNEDDISDVYFNADLFATVDWADFRLTTYEALAHRCKVLVSSETEIDNKLKHSGYLFSSEPNVETVTKKINKALNTIPVWSEKELLTYLNAFTWEKYFFYIMREVSD